VGLTNEHRGRIEAAGFAVTAATNKYIAIHATDSTVQFRASSPEGLVARCESWAAHQASQKAARPVAAVVDATPYRERPVEREPARVVKVTR
jgi:hypothetical protein